LQIIRDKCGEEIDLARLPENDPDVYGALQKADTVGMFQIESRAQMSCLPRLRPKELRHRGAGGDYSAGTNRWKNGASVFETAARSRARGMFAPFFGAGTAANSGRAAVSGATFMHGDDCLRIYGRGSRRIAPRIWLQALGKIDESCGSEAARGDGEKRNHRNHAGHDREFHHIICPLWIPRIACREFRAD